jgi:hypothetical protein
MAKRGVSRNPGYQAGSHWANCYSCGFQFRQEDLRKTWDNRWVCDEDWEPRHPQDFIRGIHEKISVEQPILPDSTATTIDVSGFAAQESTIPTATHEPDTNPST